MMVNIQAAWIGMVLGVVAGAILGLFFYNRDWLGGYASWSRRMLRLGHISFFGLAFINLSAALTVRALGMESGLAPISVLLIIGTVMMPLICFLSAFRPVFRNLFFIPAGSVLCAVALLTWKVWSL